MLTQALHKYIRAWKPTGLGLEGELEQWEEKVVVCGQRFTSLYACRHAPRFVVRPEFSLSLLNVDAPNLSCDFC